MRTMVNGNWGNTPETTTTPSNSNYVAPVGTETEGIYMKKLVRRQLRENLEVDKRKKERNKK